MENLKKQKEIFDNDDKGQENKYQNITYMIDVPNNFQAFIKHNGFFWCAYIDVPTDHNDFKSENDIENLSIHDDPYLPYGKKWTYYFKNNNFNRIGIDYGNSNIDEWIWISETYYDDTEEHKKSKLVYRNREFVINDICRILKIAIQRYNY